MPAVDASEACELVAQRRDDARYLISCEHASARLPPRWSWPQDDRRLIDTHWAYDLGAAQLARELAAQLGAALVASRFSRLLIDPNRPADSDTLILEQADGRPIALNAAVDADDRAARLGYWHGYHDTLHRLLDQSEAPILLAVHSFTDNYQGQRRDFAIGVLFDHEEQLAVRLAAAFEHIGEVRMNEPYSGKAGMIYAASRHAEQCGRRALEIEARQDLLQEASFRRAVVEAVASCRYPSLGV